MLRILMMTIAMTTSVWFGNTHANNAEIVLGQSAPVTGAIADFAAAYREGALLYFDKINQQGGVSGRRIRLLTLDDRYDAKLAAANARQLIEKENALALFGFMFTHMVRSSLPVAEKAKVAYVAPFAGYDELFQFNPVLFTTFSGFSSELHTLVRHMEAMGLKRVVLIRYAGDVGQVLEDDLATKMKSIGVTSLGSAEIPLTHDLDTPEMNAAAAKLAEMRPAAIVLGVSGEHAALFIKKFNAAAKIKPVQYLARSLVDGPLLVKRLGEESRGVVMTQLAPSPFNGKTRVAREYRATLKAAQKAGRNIKPDYTGFMGYVAAKTMVEGLRRAGPNPTRASLITALETMREWDAGDFEVSFSPMNHNGSKFVTVTVIGPAGHFIE